MMNIRKITELEYYKFRHYRPFLVILGLYATAAARLAAKV